MFAGSLELLLQCVRVRRQSVIFVEVFRLLLVIAGTIGGLTVGNDIGRNTTAPVVGITLGALVVLPPRRDHRPPHRPRSARRGARSSAPCPPARSSPARWWGRRVCFSGSWPVSPSSPSCTRASTTRSCPPSPGCCARPGCASGWPRARRSSGRPGMSHLLDRPDRAAARHRPPRGQLGGHGPLPPRPRPVRPAGRRASCVPRFVRRRGPGPVPQPRPRVVAPGPSRPRGHRGAAGRRGPGLDERGRGPRARRHRRPRPGRWPTACTSAWPRARPSWPQRAAVRGHRRRRPAPPRRRALPRPPAGRAPRHRPRQGGAPTPPGRRLPARGRHGGRQRRVAPGGPRPTSRSSSPRPARRARACSSSPSSSRVARRPGPARPQRLSAQPALPGRAGAPVRPL